MIQYNIKPISMSGSYVKAKNGHYNRCAQYLVIVYLSEDAGEIKKYLDSLYPVNSVYYPPALEMPVAEIEHNHFRTGREAAEALKQWLLTHEGTMSKYAQSFIKENIQ